MTTSRLKTVCIRAVLFLPCAGVPAAADEVLASPLDGRLQLRLGVFWPNLDSSISVDRDGLPGGRLDLEGDLGLEDAKTTPYGGVTWRLAPRHSLELEYFDLGRKGSSTARREWNIGGKTALLGAELAAELDLRMTRLTYQYALISSARHRFSLSGGIHYTTLQADLKLSGDLVIDGKPVFVHPEESVTEVDKTEAPLPHFGLQYLYSMGNDWSAHFSLIGFNVDIDNVDGRLLEINAGAQYRFNPYLGLGAGLKYFDLDVDQERKSKTTEYDFDFFGPALYLTATF